MPFEELQFIPHYSWYLPELIAINLEDDVDSPRLDLLSFLKGFGFLSFISPIVHSFMCVSRVVVAVYSEHQFLSSLTLEVDIKTEDINI